jgi:hypothetical protein
MHRRETRHNSTDLPGRSPETKMAATVEGGSVAALLETMRQPGEGG